MDLINHDTEIDNTLIIALQGNSLFELYDEAELTNQAQEDCYDNLYPLVA